jgi:serine O-acetyltransferase
MELICNNYPNKKGILLFVEHLKRVFYPCLYGKNINIKKEEEKAKYYFSKYISKNKKDDFFIKLNILKELYDKDVEAIFNGDPAADSLEEIISSYPGFTAIFYHRIAHIIYELKLPIVARIISEEAHFLTGVDIHPGATIGEYFMIDHGTGVVIGETTTIGSNVRIYQGVTLGALSLSGGHKLKDSKRHPTIGNNVIIYSGASILGGECVIGDNVIIGSNVFITESVPSNTKVIIKKPDLIVINKK